MNCSPLISILMTAYNREQFIAEAIESVLANDYANIELIIVDDSSSDETVNIARRYEDLDNRVKVHVNSRNLGDYPNRNRAASLAKGEFIMYVDSDDKLRADTLNNIFYSDEVIQDLNFGMFWHHSNEKFTLDGKKALRKHFFEQQFLYFGPGGTIIRRKYFEDIKGYPTKYGPANDMYFNLKVCCSSHIHLFPFEFIVYRFHSGQELNNKFSYIYNNYLYIKDACLDLDMNFSELELEYLNNKNKRRFIINLFFYFFKKFDFKGIRLAIQKTNFTIKDFWKAVFH